MATTTFTVTHSRASDYQGAEDMSARNVVGRVTNFLAGCASGAHGATSVAVSAEAASATITVQGFTTSTLIYIGNIELPEIDAEATDDVTAARIAFTINAPENGVAEAVTATVEENVVTVTANVPGIIGNYISIAASGSGITVSSPALAGGTTTTYNF